MTPYYIALFTLFIIVAWMMTHDKNVADYIVLQTKIIIMQLERIKFMIIYHPKNPITNFIQKQKMSKLAAMMQKEYEQKNNQL